jgi:hypothetical protein
MSKEMKETIELLLSRYRFVLSLNKVPPTAYYPSIELYINEIRDKIDELNKLLK